MGWHQSPKPVAPEQATPETATSSKIEIISDGGCIGTKVLVNGVDVSEHVVEIAWTHKGGSLPTAIVKLCVSHVAVGAGRVHYLDNNGRRVTRIEYDDVTLETSSE